MNDSSNKLTARAIVGGACIVAFAILIAAISVLVILGPGPDFYTVFFLGLLFLPLIGVVFLGVRTLAAVFREMGE